MTRRHLFGLLALPWVRRPVPIQAGYIHRFHFLNGSSIAYGSLDDPFRSSPPDPDRLVWDDPWPPSPAGQALDVPTPGCYTGPLSGPP